MSCRVNSVLIQRGKSEIAAACDKNRLPQSDESTAAVSDANSTAASDFFPQTIARRCGGIKYICIVHTARDMHPGMGAGAGASLTARIGHAAQGRHRRYRWPLVERGASIVTRVTRHAAAAGLVRQSGTPHTNFGPTTPPRPRARRLRWLGYSGQLDMISACPTSLGENTVN